jgi:hypothetical protein
LLRAATYELIKEKKHFLLRAATNELKKKIGR